jgi:hypothetical protein
MAAASLSRLGPCINVSDRLITGLRFMARDQISWNCENGASSYNVYRAIPADLPPTDVGSCLLAAVSCPSPVPPGLELPGDPLPGQIWLFVVNGNFANGEGTLGRGTDCAPRSPSSSCF